MRNLLMGIDGGGTKTDFVLCSTDGTVVDRIILGSSNPNDVGIAACCNVLRQGIERLMPAGALIGIFAGISGGVTGQNQHKIYRFLGDHFPDTPIQNDSDAAIVMTSGIHSEQGIAVISGTGSVAFAREKGIMHRIGGWGYLFDESGSGYDLGKEAIRAALAEYDGIGEKTLITDLLYHEMKKPVWDALDEIYSNGKIAIASFAPLVFRAYENGDSMAENILKKTAHYLADLILFCGKLYDCGHDVVLCGGLFNNARILLPFMEEKLNHNYHLILPSMPPVYGAVVECCKMLEISIDDSFSDRFSKSLKGFQRL